MNSVGRMRDRITLKVPTETVDVFGNAIAGYDSITPTPTVYARVRQVGGGEYYRGRRLQQDTRYVIEIRRRDDLTHAVRVEYDSDELHVNTVWTDKERRPPITILECKQVDV